MSVHRFRFKRAAAAAAITVAAIAGTVLAAPPPAEAGPARRTNQQPRLQIVRLRDTVSAQAVSNDHGARLHVRPRYVYSRALTGYAAPLTPRQVEALRRDYRVLSIEADKPVHAADAGLSWGLDRIDQPKLPNDGAFHAPGDGAGVSVYVIDTGIRRTHAQFAGSRVAAGTDLVDGGAPDDCNGHGTHVAGIAAGKTRGVAGQARIVPVRVLDCQGRGGIAEVIAGVDWVTGDHAPGTPAVANMSLGGGLSPSLDDAVRRSVASGVTYVIAAGNGDEKGDGVDACNTSPGRVAAALTVGATQDDDQPARFSNRGPCVDVWAPGVDIPSSWIGGDRAEKTISGTSMAAPFVTGAAALYLQHHPQASPAEVQAAVRKASRPRAITVPRAGTGRLLQVQGL
jgi:subtilisin family serine protease